MVAVRCDFIDRGFSNCEGVFLRFIYITIQTYTQRGRKSIWLVILSFFIIKSRHAALPSAKSFTDKPQLNVYIFNIVMLK